MLYGTVEQGEYEKLRDGFRGKELKTIETLFNKPVEIKKFVNYRDALFTIQHNPDLLAFMYVESIAIPDFARLNHWVRVTQEMSKNPNTKQYSSTYSAYLVTARNSKLTNLYEFQKKKIVYVNAESISNYWVIKKLMDTHKIDVQWIKAGNLEEAIHMVEQGKADGIGLWDHYYKTHKEKDHLKIIFKIQNLTNPALYANTRIINMRDIIKLKNALFQVQDEEFKYL